MLNDKSCVRLFCMTRAARALEIACDSRKQVVPSKSAFREI